MKKGFTLVEMLAVIVLLITLVLLVTPNVVRYMNRANDKAYEAQLKMIASSVENFYKDTEVDGNEVKSNIEYLPSNTLGTLDKKGATIGSTTNSEFNAYNYRVVKHSLATLQGVGALDYNIYNPMTGANFNQEIYVQIENCGKGIWSYSVLSDSGDVLYKNRECPEYNLLEDAVNKWLDGYIVNADNEDYRVTNRQNIVDSTNLDVSVLESDNCIGVDYDSATNSFLTTSACIDSGLYSGNISITKNNNVISAMYNNVILDVK